MSQRRRVKNVPAKSQVAATPSSSTRSNAGSSSGGIRKIGRLIRTDIEGLGPVMEALGDRQFDLYTLSREEWRRMSPRQRDELVKHQNRSQQLDHNLGPLYFDSDALKKSVDRAHELYVKMTREQRRRAIHPKHLDEWLASRRPVKIVAGDLDLPEPLPAHLQHLQPASYRLPDEGPAVTRVSPIYLTVRVNLEAPLQAVTEGMAALITALHAPAARKSRRDSPRPSRNKYHDDDVAKMVDWYYRRASGTPLKQLVIEAAGPKARHISAQQGVILRQLRWFQRQLGIA